MRIALVGKFPPIQGGVSMQNYWTAHGLAERGHDVHVFTNAREVRPPFRMHMRDADWAACEARHENGHENGGAVTVHWTDPVDTNQYFIPMASPFVTKLAGLAGRLHAHSPIDVVFSYYLEPYAVAGHLVADISGAPHVVRMAGSDSGRLWHQPQFEALYDHVLRSAESVIAGGVVAERTVARGVDPARIVSGRGFAGPENLFGPDGPILDLAALRREVAENPDPECRDLLWGDFAGDLPYFGLCGKLSPYKGSFSLLAALARLKESGRQVGLVALAHGRPDVDAAFRAEASKLGIADRVLQLPFLPHWRVPEFLRSCLAICCLEQDFPIAFHTPTLPLEVLLNGACLVASTEMVRKLPFHERLPHGYGCVAVPDVNHVPDLTRHLAAIADDPAPARLVGARGREFARQVWREVSRVAPFHDRVAEILTAAAERRRLPPPARGTGPVPFPLARMAAASMGRQPLAIDLAAARALLAEIESGDATVAPLVPALRVEIRIAEATATLDESPAEAIDPVFRLRIQPWALAEDHLAGLVPVRDPRSRLVSFDHDIAPYGKARSLADLPAEPPPGESHLVVFAGGRAPLQIDARTARVLALCDGTRTVGEIGEAGWVEALFTSGLVGLREA